MVSRSSQSAPAPSARVRRGLRWLLLMLLSLLLLALLAWYGGQYWLRQHLGIQQWSLELGDWDWQRLELRNLWLVRNNQAGRQELSATNLRLSWNSLRPLRLKQVEADRLHLNVWPGTDESPADATHPLQGLALLMDRNPVLPAFLPQQLRLSDVQLELPCAQGRCELQGMAQFRMRSQDTYELTAQLRRQGQSLDLHGLWQLSAGTPQLQWDITVAGQPWLNFQSGYSGPESDSPWQGQLTLQGLPERDWLLGWMRDWGVQAQGLPMPQLWDQLQLRADWSLPAATLATPAATTVTVADAEANQLSLDRFWPLLAAGTWNLDLQLPALLLPQSIQIPSGLNPGALHWQVQARPLSREDRATPPASPASQTPVQLTTVLQTDGELKARLEAKAQWTLQSPPSLQLNQLNLSAQAAQFQWPSSGSLLGGQAASAKPAANTASLTVPWQLKGANLNASLSGQLAGRTLSLQLSQPAQLTLERLQRNDLVLKSAELSLESSQALSWVLGDTVMEGLPPIDAAWRLQVQQLQQPLLQPTGWSAQGDIHWQAGKGQTKTPPAADATMSAKVSADNGLSLQLQAQQFAQKPWQLTWKLDDVFLLAGNPLAKTFVSWPESLELSRGKLKASGRLDGPAQAGNAPGLAMQVEFQDVSGVLRRSLVEGLNGTLSVQLKNEQLQVASDSLRVQNLDPGVALSPLALAGSYRAPLTDWRHGELDLRHAQAQMLGGRIWVDPIHIVMSDAGTRVPLKMESVDLSRLLKVYASEGISGHGILDGEIPLRIAATGLSVANGQVSARAPGGVLKYRPEQPQTAMQSDLRMKMFMKALEDFHYSVLVSRVNYAEDGTLTLGVQIQGRNPSLKMTEGEQKFDLTQQDFNLNLNVENNLLKQLASLQLASEIPAALEKQIRRWLQQQASKPSP